MRLAQHDYAGGVYFATVCTIDRHPIFSDVSDGRLVPSSIGQIVDQEWNSLRTIPGLTLDEYVVMPNHVHAILAIERGSGRTLPSIMQLFKSRAVKSLQAAYRDRECRILQRGYHDDILNGPDHVAATRLYIRNNPANWEADEYWWRGPQV